MAVSVLPFLPGAIHWARSQSATVHVKKTAAQRNNGNLGRTKKQTKNLKS